MLLYGFESNQNPNCTVCCLGVLAEGNPMFRQGYTFRCHRNTNGELCCVIRNLF